MTMRHALAVVFGGIGMIAMHHLYPEGFDGIGAVSLFTAIIAVAPEDMSLGPIIHKSLFRVVGVCLGGLMGYILLFFPIVLVHHSREACLIVIITTYIFFAQYATRGGWSLVSSFVKDKRAAHMTLQFQLAFGAVFIGGWNSDQNSVLVSSIRTLSIVYGCVCVLLSSLITLPQTSLHASCSELASSLRAGGQLTVLVCSDRANGVRLDPYDHLARGFSSMKPDGHIELMDTIDTKLARVQSLQPFLLYEPAWVPGLPFELVAKEAVFAPNWASFIATILSRLTRLRCTLTVMDSMSRIDSDVTIKSFHPAVASQLENLSELVNEALCNTACFVESPFLKQAGYRGDLGMQRPVSTCLVDIKTSIQSLVECAYQNIQRTHTVEDLDKCSGPSCTVQASESTHVNLFKEHHCGVDVKTKHIRDRLGNETMENWHKIFPLRSFCTLAVHSALQAAAILVEVTTFMEFIAETDVRGLPLVSGVFGSNTVGNLSATQASDQSSLCVLAHSSVV
jgi:hypothetical protein